MPKEKSPPVNLDKYLEGRNHKYMTYEKASRLYGLPFWGFVSVAKEAKATCSHIGVRPQCGQLKPRMLKIQRFWAYILDFFI